MILSVNDIKMILLSPDLKYKYVFECVYVFFNGN